LFKSIRTAPLARSLAQLLVLTTLLLLGVGGLVTTYRVGMAVPDWPTTFGQTMFSYPLGEMLEDLGLTLEHSHRLLGSVVGLLSIALLFAVARPAGRQAMIACCVGIGLEVVAVGKLYTQSGSINGGAAVDWVAPAGPFAGAVLVLVAGLFFGSQRGTRALALLTHLAIIGQGLLGGTRVLENNVELAFLHGSLAQLVFLIAAVTATLVGTARATTRAGLTPLQKGPFLLTIVALVVVLGQAVLGAWTRHTGQTMAAGLHAVFALIVLGVVLLLFVRLGAFERETRSPVVRSMRRGLLHLVGAQIVLGVATLIVILMLAGGFNGHVTVTEAILASAHVMVGALLLAAVGRAAVISLGVRVQLSTAGASGNSSAPTDPRETNHALQAGGIA
jgi:heme a synthase